MTPATDRALDAETRDAVTDLLIRYATAIDSRDWALIRTCFTEDCDADYGEIGHWHGADEIAGWMAATHDPLGPTLHRITNVALAREPEVVRARCYVHGVVVLPDRSAAVHAYGWYDDEVVATPAGWRVSRRRYTPVTTDLHARDGLSLGFLGNKGPPRPPIGGPPADRRCVGSAARFVGEAQVRSAEHGPEGDPLRRRHLLDRPAPVHHRDEQHRFGAGLRTTEAASNSELPRVTVSSVTTTRSPGSRAPAIRPPPPWSFASLRTLKARQRAATSGGKAAVTKATGSAPIVRPPIAVASSGTRSSTASATSNIASGRHTDCLESMNQSLDLPDLRTKLPVGPSASAGAAQRLAAPGRGLAHDHRSTTSPVPATTSPIGTASTSSDAAAATTAPVLAASAIRTIPMPRLNTRPSLHARCRRGEQSR